MTLFLFGVFFYLIQHSNAALGPPTANFSFGENPIVLNTRIHIDDVNSLDEHDMDFRLDYYLQHSWTASLRFCEEYAEKLNVSGVKLGEEPIIITVSPSVELSKQIWFPDTMLSNAKEDAMPSTVANTRVLRLSRPQPDGNCSLQYIAKLQALVTCSMNFRTFPVDTQRCILEFRSYSYDRPQLYFTFLPAEEPNVTVNHDLIMLEQNLTVSAWITEEVQLDEIFSVIYLECVFERFIWHNLIQIYAPSIMIVAMSWFSFWLSLDVNPGRITLCVTAQLALVNLIASIREELPPLNYLTAADVWVIVCMLFVFGTLLEFAIAKFIRHLQDIDYLKRKKVMKFDPNAAQNNSKSVQLKKYEYYVKENYPKSDSEADKAVKKRPAAYKYQNVSPVPVIRMGPLGPPGPCPHCQNWVSEGTKKSKKVVDKNVVKVRVDWSLKIDKISRSVFPATFVLFNLLYWPILFTLASKSDKKSH